MGRTQMGGGGTMQSFKCYLPPLTPADHDANPTGFTAALSRVQTAPTYLGTNHIVRISKAMTVAFANSNTEADRLRKRIRELEARQQGRCYR